MPYITYSTRPNYFYVYDMNKNSVYKLSERNYNGLTDLSNGKKSDEALEILESFQNKGLLVDSPIKKIEHPATPFLEYQLNSCVNSVTFQMTQNCNLRCSYCPYSDTGLYNHRSHKNKNIKWPIVKKGIDFLVEHSSEAESLYVSFYGGEPLIVKDLVLKAMKYAIEQVNGKEITFGMTTNATLLDDEFANAVQDYNVSLLISLDGPKEVHDKNRTFINGNGSFDILYKNVKHIKENYPKLYERIRFNTVISPGSDYKSIWEFFRTNQDICDLSKVAITTLSQNYTNEEIQYDESFYAEWNYELLKTYLKLFGKLENENILDHKGDVEMIYMMEETFQRRNTTPEVMHPSGTCIPGLKKLFININGNFYPCERIDENSSLMKIGSLEEGFYLDKIKELLNSGAVTEDNCKNCWAFNHCTICPASADNGVDEHYSREYKLKKCMNIRKNALALIKDYTMLKEHNFQFSTEDFNNERKNCDISN